MYDNARVNEEYTSLDTTKVEGKPIYQSLINEQEIVVSEKFKFNVFWRD